MFKLAVFDLDGTLLNKHHEISDENLKAIEKLEASGCHIMIATGRPDTLVKEYIKKLNINEPIISCNGAVVRNPFTKETILNKIIPKEDVKNIIDLCKIEGYLFMAYSDDLILTTNNYRMQYFLERNEKLEDDCKGNFLIEEDSHIISEEYKINKILVIEKDEEKYKKINEKFKAFINLSKVQSASGFYDIMPANTSKKHAIDCIIDYYNIKLSEVVAFGDNYNDLEMLKHVGVAITTENGVEPVKDIADFISKDHNDHGVAFAIETFVLKENLEA